MAPLIATVVVVIVVVSGLTLAGVILRPPSSPTTPANIQVDRYPAGSSYTGQYGDEPYIARAPNGTAYVAWIGYDLLGSTIYLPSGQNFTTSIWLSSSATDGQTYSQAIRLSPASEPYAFDPSIAILPNGTILVAWLNETLSGPYSVVLATLFPGARTFSLSVPVVGYYLDRPWITSSSNGTVFLTYNQFTSSVSASTFWTVSYDGGQSFSPPRFLTGVTVTTAIVAGSAGTLYVAGFVQNPDFVDGPTQATFWVARVDTLNETTTSVVSVATTWLPYPIGFTFGNESWPGPALTVVGDTLVVVYSADNASELVSKVSTDGGSAWSAPAVLERASGVLFYMPWLTPLNSEAALAWRDTAQGSWNTYTAVLNTANESLGGIHRVNSQPGYPASVLNWHGDFLGAVSVSSTTYVVVWGDGRNLPNVYGLNHIYSATIVQMT